MLFYILYIIHHIFYMFYVSYRGLLHRGNTAVTQGAMFFGTCVFQVLRLFTKMSAIQKSREQEKLRRTAEKEAWDNVVKFFEIDVVT